MADGTTMCGLLNGTPPDLPDAGEGGCCYGAAVYGKDRCTCWEPVYDVEQQPIIPAMPLPPIPVRMCHDCAYRPGSPERQGDPGYNGDQEALDGLIISGEPFFCHQGIRKPVRWRHPSGVEIPGHPAAYSPPIEGNVPYKADGTPAGICAGWLLRRVRRVKEVYR